MKKIIYLLLSLACTSNAIAQVEHISYPPAQTGAVQDNYFGTTVSDPYRWLEDDSLPATQQWLEAEAAFSEKYLKRLVAKYQPENQLRLNSFEDYGTVNRSGKYYFDFLRYSWEFDSSPSLYIKKKIKDKGELAVDPSDYKIDKHDKAQICDLSVSEDNKFIAFGISHSGSDWQEIYVKTLYPFHKLEDKLEEVKFSSIEWSGNGFFYVRFPMKGNILKERIDGGSIWYHKLGDKQSNDMLVYDDKSDLNAKVDFDKVKGNYLIIYADNDNSAVHRILTIDLKKKPFTVDTLIVMNHEVPLGIIGEFKDQFLAITSLNAPHYRLLLVDKKQGNKITPFVQEHNEVLRSVDIVGNKVLCTYLKDADYMAVTFDSAGNAVNKIEFPTGSSAGGFEDDDNDSVSIFYCSSFLYPPIVYEYNVNSFTTKLVQKTKVSYDASEFEITKVFYRSKDGTTIRCSLPARKEWKKMVITPRYFTDMADTAYQ